MTTKTTDSKGRLTLGERFANRTVIVEEIDETEVRITLARVVPERELWLQETVVRRLPFAAVWTTPAPAG